MVLSDFSRFVIWFLGRFSDGSIRLVYFVRLGYSNRSLAGCLGSFRFSDGKAGGQSKELIPRRVGGLVEWGVF